MYKIKYLVAIIALCLCNLAFAQKDSINEAKTEVFTGVEEMPEYNGDMYRFISKNIHYPKEAREMGAQGKVLLQLIINSDGTISNDNIKVVNSAGYGMDEEAVRVIKLMPPWKPGKQNGKPVAVRIVIPITFKIDR